MSRPHSLFPFALDPLADLARVARSFEAALQPKAGFPAHDVLRHGEDSIELRFAVAGFKAEQLDVSLDGAELKVSGSQTESREAGDAGPERRFALAERAEVESAALADGILSVRVRITRPEATSRKIEIAAAA